jgi:rod shape determining protein RodA
MLNKIDWQIIGSAILISILGCVALLSTTVTSTGTLDFGGIFLKQIAFVLIGLAIYYFTAKFDFTYFKYIQVSGAFYLSILFLLIMVLIIGPSINQAQRWLIIAGVQLQPSEFAKIAVILLTASIISGNLHKSIWVRAALSFIPVLVMAVFIYVQPHGAMTLIVLALWFMTAFTLLPSQLRNILVILIVALTFVSIFLLFSGVVSMGLILLGIALCIVIVALLLSFKEKKVFLFALAFALIFGLLGNIVLNYVPFFEHQKGRIEAFLNPEETSQDKGFNVDQAKVAIGSGQILGKGFGFGTQSKLNYLPEHQTDFIFSAFAEEFGLLGTMFLLSLYAIMIMRIFVIALRIHDYFSASVILLLGIKIMLEVFINIGTNTGIIPATGIPLPLFSAGGTITLATFFSLGLIQSIISNSPVVILDESE